MLQKAALALFGLVLAGTLMAPRKSAAQIHIGVRIGSPEQYGVVVVQPAPYVVYDEPYFVEHNWDSGYHDGYYYGRGTRYRRDDRGYRHYDDRFRQARHDRDRGEGHWQGDWQGRDHGRDGEGRRWDSGHDRNHGHDGEGRGR